MTAKRKSPPESGKNSRGHNTCDASNIPETGAKGKRSQPTEKAVPPRRTRTAPASRSGARDAPSGGLLERQQRTCAEDIKAERQIVHTPTADAGYIGSPGDAQTVAKPEAVAQPPEPIYPAQAQRAGGGCAINQPISPKPKGRGKAKAIQLFDVIKTLQGMPEIKGSEYILAVTLSEAILSAYFCQVRDHLPKRGAKIGVAAICDRAHFSRATYERAIVALKRAKLFAVEIVENESSWYRFHREFEKRIKGDMAIRAARAAEKAKAAANGEAASKEIIKTSPQNEGDPPLKMRVTPPVTEDPFPPFNPDGPMTKWEHESGEVCREILMEIDGKKEKAR